MTAVPFILNIEVGLFEAEVRAGVGVQSFLDTDSWLSSRFALPFNANLDLLLRGQFDL